MYLVRVRLRLWVAAPYYLPPTPLKCKQKIIKTIQKCNSRQVPNREFTFWVGVTAGTGNMLNSSGNIVFWFLLIGLQDHLQNSFFLSLLLIIKAILKFTWKTIACSNCVLCLEFDRVTGRGRYNHQFSS